MALLVVLLVLAGLAALLYVAWRRRRLSLVFIGVAAVFGVLWGLALAAIWTDYRDADGFVDCWPNCTAFQTAVAGTFWYGPLVLTLLGLIAAALGTVTWHRQRGSRRSG